MDSGMSLKTYYGFIFIKKGNGTICGRYPVTKKECILGRGNNCDIKILLENVSAHHCSILFVDDKAYVRDKSIAGTTTVNGKKIGRNNFLLHHADEIDIGGRKFGWEYAKSYIEPNYLSGKKACTRNSSTSSNAPEHSSNQVNKPLVPKNDNKMTPVAGCIKTPSKTLLSINKTPIIVAASNMSKSSFDILKNSLQKQNSSVTAQSEHQKVKSLAMVPGRNIPLIGDSKVGQRKSWVVTHTPNNSSSSGVHVLNRLSCERLKRDSTPEFNSSYHYADENVEFDSPEPPNVMFDDEHSVHSSAAGKAEDTFNKDVSSNSNICDLHSNSRPEPGTSRRDTYSIDDIPIVVEQNTPVPRRSILKCSKTTKPNRSRSSCRMVQFARLPNTDGRIKVSKRRFYSGSNFIVSNNELNETNHSEDSKKVTFLDPEEFDDDLDGVQPLDSSVSSLINSPILDISNISKSSKRGSRGNKVMSLVNSIEKRANEPSMLSIRASDLLSMSGSKDDNTSSETNTIISQNSSRRINLENVFEAEDSFKKVSCNTENVTTVQETDGSLFSSSEINLVNNSNLQTLSNNVEDELSSDHVDDDKIRVECSKYFEQTVEKEISTIGDEMPNNISENVKESVAGEKDNSIIGDKIPNTISENVQELVTVNKEISTIGDQMPNNIEELAAVKKEILSISDEMSNVSENINESTNVEKDCLYNQNNVSKSTETSIDEEKDNFVVLNNSEYVKNLSSKKRKHLDVQNVLEIINKSDNRKKSNINVQNSVSETAEQFNEDESQLEVQNNSKIIQKKHLDVQNVSKIVNKLLNVTKVYSNSQNDVSRLDERPNDEFSLLIAPCMSEVSNTSDNRRIKCGTPNVQHEENEFKKNPKKSLRIDELSGFNEKISIEIINDIEMQLQEIHSDKSTSSNFNEQETFCDNSTYSINNEETQLSSFVLVETDNPHQEIDKNISLNSINSSSCIESSKDGAVTASNLITSVKDNNVTEVLGKTAETENSTIKINNTKNDSTIIKSIGLNDKSTDLSETMSLYNLFNNRDINDSQNSIQKKTTTSKDSPITKNSIQLDKSKQFTKNTPTVLQNTETGSTEIECLSSDPSEENLEHETYSGLEQSFDTSIGKPRYESTPWNGSKSSKSIQPNLCTDVSENNDQQRNRSRSVTPFNDPESWSQMMRDFNESVRKASTSNRRSDVNTSYKFVYNKQSNKCKTAIQLTNIDCSINKKSDTVESSPKNTSKSSNVGGRSTRNSKKLKSHSHVKNSPTIVQYLKPVLTFKRDKVNTAINNCSLQKTHQTTKLRSSIITTDSESESDSNKKSLIKSANESSRNKIKTEKRKLKGHTLRPKVITSNSETENDKSPIKSSEVSSSSITTRNKKKCISSALQKYFEIDNSSNNDKSSFKSSSTSSGSKKMSSPTIKVTRRNLRTRMKKNEINKSIKKQTKSNTIFVKEGSINKSSIKSKSEVSSPKSENVLRTARNKEYSLNNKSIVKDTISVKPKKNKSNVTNASKIKVTDKSHKIESPAKTRITRSNTTSIESSIPKSDKKNKTLSPVKTKSSKVVKTIKNSKSSKSNKKSQPKRILPSEPIYKKASDHDSSNNEDNTENPHSVNKPTKNKEKRVQSDNNLSSLSTKRNLRERVGETSNASTQLSTRSRKRNADTSPTSQPIAKSKKSNNSSKVASTTISRVSNSPPKHSSSNTKRTRQLSKLQATQDLNNSIKETSAGSKKMEKTQPKKRVINSEDDSIDLAPSTRKITRKATAKVTETEIKKLTRATSKNCTTDEACYGAKVKFDKNVVKKSITPNTIKPKSTRQAVSQEKYSSPAPRVLRSRK